MIAHACVIMTAYNPVDSSITIYGHGYVIFLRKNLQHDERSSSEKDAYGCVEQCSPPCEATEMITKTVQISPYPADRYLDALQVLLIEIVCAHLIINSKIDSGEEYFNLTMLLYCYDFIDIDVILLFERYAQENGWNTNVSEIININLYFSSTDELVITTAETTPLFTLVSNVGGQMG